MRFALPLVLLLASVTTGQTPVDKDHYFTKWTDARNAHEHAKQFRVGILYHFPAKGQTELHEIFGEEPMSQLSRRTAVVNVDEKCRDGEKLRKQYSVSEKELTFVMTDYYGNEITRIVAKRGLREKLDVDKMFGRILKNAQKWVEAQQKKLAKDLKKAERYFEKEDWSRAIPELKPIAAFDGYEASESARKLLAEIELKGEEALLRAEKLDLEERIKALKKIAKEFEGTPVEKKADEARAKLEAKP